MMISKIGRCMLPPLFCACMWCAPAAHPLLHWLGPETRIVVSHNASDMERAAAQKLSLASGASGAMVVDDNWIMDHREHAGSLNLIVVGTFTGNRLLVEFPSLWSRSKEQQGGRFPVRGLFFFGVGDLPGDRVGVVEPGRNPFNVELEDKAHHEGTQFTDWTWMIRLSSRTPAGVAAAVHAFLENFMLSGVIPDRFAPEGEPPFVLTRSQVDSRPPPWTQPSRNSGIVYIGWHQVNALLLSGFESESGIRPEQMWRYVFRDPARITAAASSPHRTTTTNEILLCRMTNQREAKAAATNLMSKLGHVSTTRDKGIILLSSEKNGDTVYAAVKGEFLAVESLDSGRDQRLLLDLMASMP